ncbi:MAG: hypothetical protein ACOYOL_02105 [Chthoniobacterales bacterium]
MNDPVLPAKPPKAGGIKRIIIMVVLASIAVHLAAGVIAGVVIVARYFAEPPAEFKAVKDIRIPAQDREHRMNMSSFDGGAAKPAFTDKMASARPTAFALPDLPQVPINSLVEVDPTGIVSDQLSGIMSGTGTGSGYGSGSGGGGGGSGSAVSFFGISDTATRVIIVVDVSDTMFDRMPGKFQAVKQEAAKLIKGLGINTLFNIIIYEGGSVAMFPDVQPATDANKAKAAAWIESVDGGSGKQGMSYKGKYSKMGTGLYEGGGTRTDTALKQALSMRPSTIFLISDGEMSRRGGGADTDDAEGSKIEEKDLANLIKEGQSKMEQPARIHVIHFLTKDARKEEEDILRGISRRNEGRFKQVKAEDY